MVNIYSFYDPIFYLQKYYALYKSEGYGLRQFSTLLAFDRVEVLKDILKRTRKIRLKYIDQIATGLDLNDDQKTYFLLMIKYVNASNTQERNAYKIALENWRDESGHLPLGICKDDHLFSNWLYMAILSLGKISTFELSTSNIQTSLIKEVGIQEIEDALNYLLKCGLLAKKESGELYRTLKNVATLNDEQDNSTHKYFKQVFELAKESISSDVLAREFQCFSLPLATKDLNNVKSLMRELREKLTERSISSSDQIYQVNLALFPLSKRFGIDQNLVIIEKDLDSQLSVPF